MSQFPKNTCSRTTLHTSLRWTDEKIVTSYEIPLNGHVYYYRDKEVPLKELSAEEKQEIESEEAKKRELVKNKSSAATSNEDDSLLPPWSSNGTNGTAASSSTSSSTAKIRRKEKALKIYVDSSPVKSCE